MSPVDDPILQNGEECSASGGDLEHFPLALSFQNGFVGNGRTHRQSARNYYTPLKSKLDDARYFPNFGTIDDLAGLLMIRS